MTILSAASRIIDDLVDSGSFLRTEVSACDYGILDDCETCAVVVTPRNSGFDYIAYGRITLDTWGFGVEGFVDGTGDPTEVLGRVYHMHDALKGAINGGSNANNAQYTTQVKAMFFDPNTSWVSPGGHDFALVSATVTVREDA